jgi:hypothetical protein
MRGDVSCSSSSLPFGGEGETPNETKRADSLLTAGLNNREARANPATATPAPAPGSPKRASLDVPFTPGSPHYKLYPDYKAG